MRTEEPSHVGPEDWAFINGPLEAVPGWLNKITAACTMEMLIAQDGILPNAPMLEIGVYGGKYYSLLARHAGRVGSKILGVDIFYAFPPEKVLDNVRVALTGFELPQMEMRKVRSQALRPDELLAFAGTKFRFAHIDGSHEAEDVFQDLWLANAVLAEGGIIAIDDFYSPYDAGVTEGFFRFQLALSSPLVLICYVANKGFVCHPAYAARYRGCVERFLMEDQISPASGRFRERIGGPGGRRMVEPALLGSKMLVVV